ncbi:hypothetical protein DPMN_075304 [Dreissena polymorpha]|uniref:Uncharacterized protein n=1 Tax=Dreissena polymorpha TaxID=45954 RepID=A0A9D3YK46_DREPO|nr:hypothetical protein DPMN_075304 [Dreissena polymorpha]
METREYRGEKSGGTICHLSMNAKMHTFDAKYLMTGVGHELGDTAKAEQTYFAIRGGKAKRVDAASVVEAASVCGGK